MPNVACPQCGCCDGNVPSPLPAKTTTVSQHVRKSGGCDKPWKGDLCNVIFLGLEYNGEGAAPTPFVAMAYDRETGHIVDRNGQMICEHRTDPPTQLSTPMPTCRSAPPPGSTSAQA